MRQLRRVLVLSVGLTPSLLPQLASAQSAGPAVTADGRYVLASVRKTTSKAEVPTLVVQATRGSWRLEIPGGTSPRLLPDNKALLWQRGDTLWRLPLGAAGSGVVAAGVQSYELLGRAPGGPWLLYRSSGAERGTEQGALVLRQLGTGRERRFADVSAYVVAPDERTVLLCTTTTQGASAVMASAATASGTAASAASPSAASPSTGPTVAHTTLRWVALPAGVERTIWTGPGQLASGSAAVTFDAAGRQVVFTVETPRDSGAQQTLWRYAAGAPAATVLVEDGMPGVEAGFTVAVGVNFPVRFSASGQRVFFGLREPARPQPMSGAVDIWSYTDAKVQSQQLLRLTQRRIYAAAALLPERRVVRLEQAQEVLLGEPSDEHALLCAFEDNVLAYGRDGQVNEVYTMSDYNWSRAAQCSVTLMRLRDGARAVLRAHMRNTNSTFPYFRLSPAGRYVVFYDPWQKEYGSYELASGVTRPLTRGNPARWAVEDLEGGPGMFNHPVGIRGWLPAEAAVLVADHYSDLWQLDLTGRRPPVNLTNGYARRHQPLRFRWRSMPDTIFDRQAVLLVEAGLPWNIRRLLVPSGWYRVRLDRVAEPRELIKLGGEYRYGDLALAARGGDTVYVATRENLTEPPGTWYTRDFRTWMPVTDDRPEQRRPRPRQLLTWKTFDGQEAQGVLWLPRDFDPRRKYPVIVDIYEKWGWLAYADGRFRAEDGNPGLREWTGAGYLLFAPNIHYTIGATGESVYNAVASGAQYLTTMPFVDGRRLGLTGFSFGGFETRYLLTRTSIFAAAYSGAGVSNLLSFYGTEEKDEAGFSYMATAEGGQYRLRGMPWERPEVYLRHSAVLHADQITTPLLLYHNYDDYRVPFSQSMELYAALRRLGKPVWLMAGYGGHVNPSGDGEVRVRQFFDHYLKGAPAPRWMTRGIPAARRGLETGLELDSTTAGPGPGLLLDTQGRAPAPERLFTQGRRHDSHGAPASAPAP